MLPPTPAEAEDIESRIDTLDHDNGSLEEDVSVILAQMTEATEAADPDAYADRAGALAETAGKLAAGAKEVAALWRRAAS